MTLFMSTLAKIEILEMWRLKLVRLCETFIRFHGDQRNVYLISRIVLSIYGVTN